MAAGDRPVLSLTLTLDGARIDWSNPGVPVTVSIPYVPTAEELESPESIVVWYLDGSGGLNCVTSGRCDPKTGIVTFRATHFSLYAGGYNPVESADVAGTAWYADAVGCLAARGITAARRQPLSAPMRR